MLTVMVYIVMKLETIRAIMQWGAALYGLYLIAGFGRRWLSSMESEDTWRAYWMPLRRKVTAMVFVVVAAFLLPSPYEAAAMTILPAIAKSTLWDRAFGSGFESDTIEQVKHWLTTIPAKNER